MIQSSAIQQVLDDSSFQEAIKDLKKMHVEMICNSEADEDRVREIAYMRITTLNEIMGHLESLAANKKINDSKWKI